MGISEAIPTVSIIVPVWNGEVTIKNLLESLIRLKYPEGRLEVVVVDGNSVDGTRDIVAEYPVKLIVEKRVGLNIARNTGLKNSSSEIVAFTDSDCVVPENWISKIVDNFKDSTVGCVGGTVKSYGEDFIAHYADDSVMPVMRNFAEREKLSMVKLFMRFPAGCNMAFRREVFNEAGCFDENIRYSCDEVELVERVCKKGYRMVLDPEVLVYHKHRQTFKQLVKQTFQYGRGFGGLLRRKGLRDLFSFWAFTSILGFTAWLITVATTFLFFLATGMNVFLATFLLFTLGPLICLAGLYGYKALKHRRYMAIVVYPIVDYVRMLAFCTGEIYQLLKL